MESQRLSERTKAGLARRGVPIGTTAIISSFMVSTIRPMVICLMESTKRMMPPAMAKEPMEMSKTFRINCPKNRKIKPTITAVKMAICTVLFRSRGFIPSLNETRKGMLPIASITMKRGIKVKTNDSNQLSIRRC